MRLTMARQKGHRQAAALRPLPAAGSLPPLYFLAGLRRLRRRASRCGSRSARRSASASTCRGRCRRATRPSASAARTATSPSAACPTRSVSTATRRACTPSSRSRRRRAATATSSTARAGVFLDVGAAPASTATPTCEHHAQPARRRASISGFADHPEFTPLRQEQRDRAALRFNHPLHLTLRQA